MGTFVGISGPRDGSNGEFVPPPVAGSLGSVEVAGAITDPSLVNLYQAELNLRILLPIHLISFDARKTADSKSLLTWTVAEPETNDQFVVQWCTDGINFQDVASIHVAPMITNYHYEHNVPDWSATQYYRLKVITTSGSVIYSAVKILRPQSLENKLSIYPNPVTDYITVDLSKFNSGEVQYLRIVNGVGQTLKLINASSILNKKEILLDVRALAPAGYYIEAGMREVIYRKQFIKR
jgi:hypothetical protein